MYALHSVPEAILESRIQTVFDRKLGFKGTNGAHVRDQELKIY